MGSTSSAYHPHANCRAEVAVKTTKRLIAGNTGPGGTLQNGFHKALLQYRNCPSPDTGMSPATCLFGRATRDLLPGIPPRFKPHADWNNKLDLRERALSKRRVAGRARWDEHTQGLTPLKCGDTVLVQNQTGRHPNKWDKSGMVVEVLQYHQYAVRTDGSGRLTTRNRRYLRRYTPSLPRRLTRYIVTCQPRRIYRPSPLHQARRTSTQAWQPTPRQPRRKTPITRPELHRPSPRHFCPHRLPTD